MMEIRNPQYTATGAIDCEVDFHGLGWLPFTATPDDPEAHGREIFALAEAMGPAAYVPPEPQPPSIQDYSAAVQAHVDAVAQARDYRHGDALAGHVNDPKPEWAAEAAAFVNWRSTVWQLVHALWASPPDQVPTPAEVVAGLPVIEWPEVGE